ncbi:hypothetical protein E2C01_082722 [Portunus trituberculatus]|uniref:Uncharacterized protein n=1 Tax=Portunus trituberculatus TaxID=210409 RepID=A0A5B7J5X1_PORTR|nr:hypothetical protein [Portunus trituberculatus]
MYLGKLASLNDDSPERHICNAGNFNAKPSSDLFRDLEDVLRELCMIVADVAVIPPATITHVSSGGPFSRPKHLEYIQYLHRTLCQFMLEAGRAVFGSMRKTWWQVPNWR